MVARRAAIVRARPTRTHSLRAAASRCRRSLHSSVVMVRRDLVSYTRISDGFLRSVVIAYIDGASPWAAALAGPRPRRGERRSRPASEEASRPRAYRDIGNFSARPHMIFVSLRRLLTNGAAHCQINLDCYSLGLVQLKISIAEPERCPCGAPLHKVL